MRLTVPEHYLPVSPADLEAQGYDPDTYYQGKNHIIPTILVAKQLAEQGYDLATYSNGKYSADGLKKYAPQVELPSSMSDADFQRRRKGILAASSVLKRYPVDGTTHQVLTSEEADNFVRGGSHHAN